MQQYQTTKFLDGFVFLEGPRWHDGALWVSDMVGQKVYRIGDDGPGSDCERFRTTLRARVSA